MHKVVSIGDETLTELGDHDGAFVIRQDGELGVVMPNDPEDGDASEVALWLAFVAWLFSDECRPIRNMLFEAFERDLTGGALPRGRK